MGKLNMQKMESVQKELANSGNYNTNYDKLENGNNLRRVLPPKGDSDSFFSTGYMHFGLGDDGKRAATCLETYGEGDKCPICAMVEELSRSKNKDDKEYAKRISKVKRTYINVINRDGDNDSPLVLPIGQTILKGIIDLICDPDYGDITDFEEGTDITIKKAGTGLKTTYTVTPKRNPSIASEEFTEKELDEAMADLEDLFRKETVASLQAILDGEEYDELKDDEGVDDSDSYDEMDVDELIDLCSDRGIEMPAKPTRLKLIRLLQNFDEENYEDYSDDEETTSDEDEVEETSRPPKTSRKSEESDDLQDEIAKALARRRNKNK